MKLFVSEVDASLDIVHGRTAHSDFSGELVVLREWQPVHQQGKSEGGEAALRAECVYAVDLVLWQSKIRSTHFPYKLLATKHVCQQGSR